MPGDTITTFFGEFLVNPIALELSLNYCSHSCPYCFANLNSQYRKERDEVPLRYADTKGIMSMIQNYWERDTLEAFWLREGHPVLISNKVDPFASSNYRTALPIMEVMTALDIPIALQTKGGRGIDEALEFLKPSVWYITIEMQNDELCKQLEPAAPSIESRFELIQKLIDRGHRVVVGLNPLTVEWMPNPAPILQRCKDLGVWGVWIELLHFNKDQRAIATRQGIIPEAMLERYKKRMRPEEVSFEHLLKTRAIARDIGLEVYGTGQSTYSRYFDVYKEVYPKLLPTFQDWVNHCWDQGWDETRPITFAEFADFFEPLLPKGRQRLGHYIGATAHQIPREMGAAWSNWMSWRELLEWHWKDPRLKHCPVGSPAFAYLAGEGWSKKTKLQNLQTDDQGLPLMAFWPRYQEFLREEI